MTADYPMPTPPGPPTPKPVAWYRRTWVMVLAALILGVAIGTATGSSSSDDETGASVDPTPIESTQAFQDAVDEEAERLEGERVKAEASAAAQAKALEDAEAAAAAPPKAADFRIAVRVKEQQCFGSAGCNVTVGITPSYVGSGDTSNIEVTYQIRGGEDGPLIDTFTIDEAGTASFTAEHSLSTSSRNAKITAVATNVARDLTS